MNKLKIVLVLLLVLSISSFQQQTKNTVLLSDTIEPQQNEESEIPVELQPFAALLNKFDVELKITPYTYGAVDTIFLIKQLYYEEDTTFAILITANQGRQSISFYKKRENRWIKMDSYTDLYLEGGIDYKIDILARGQNANSFMLKAGYDGGKSFYIFMPNRKKNKIVLFDKLFYEAENTSYRSFPPLFVSARDTFSWKGDNLPCSRYRIFEEYYKITVDTFHLNFGRYNFIRGEYFVSKWINYTENHSGTVSYDSIKISVLQSETDKYHQRLSSWHKQLD